MNDQDLKDIAESFGISAKRITEPKDAFLASVHILDDKHILRSRSSDTIKQLRMSYALVDSIREKIPFTLPALLRTGEGDRFIERDGVLWMAYPLISGNVLGTWKEIEHATLSDTRLVFDALRALQGATIGGISKPEQSWFVERMREIVTPSSSGLSAFSQNRVQCSLQAVESEWRQLPAGSVCFVHGDFHHGNILVDRQRSVVGLIDCDWCRVGHPFEDLAYLVMMCLRKYSEPRFRFDDGQLRSLLRLYELSEEQFPLFSEYLLLYALFDIRVFASVGSSESQSLHAYQCAMCEQLCSTL